MLKIIEELNKIEILLMSGISTVIITHLFHRFKLKSEQRIRFQNIIGDKISNSLIELRELIEEVSTIERYDIIYGNEDDGEMIDAFEGTIYPAVMNDEKTLADFTEKINELRGEHEKNLDCRTALYLWYGSRYFSQLLIYVRSKGYQNKLPELGSIIILDVQDWYLSFDRVLVNRINSPLNKIEHHQGKKWYWYRKKHEKRYEKSVLNNLIHHKLENYPEFNEFFEYMNDDSN